MALLKNIGMIVVAGAAVAGCTQTNNKAWDPTRINSFKVEITSGQTGSASSPLAFTTSGMSYSLKATAIDSLGNVVTGFTGPVNVSAEPGQVFGGDTLAFTAGVAQGTIQLKRAFGVTRIWVEDPATYATGVTDAIYIRGPKISDIQTSPNTVNSPFNGQRVIVDNQSQLVVAELGRDGFYLTDVGVANGAWASIYAYTFGSPQGIQPGDQITNLSGTVSEFLGFTELNNPTWDSTGGTLPEPPYHLLSCTDLNAADPNLNMEAYESSKVELDNAAVQVCSSFPSCPDYDQYRQWTVVSTPGNCVANVVSNFTLIGFDPTQNVGKVFTKLKGTLRNVQYAHPSWIFEPHSPADVCCPSCTPAFTQGC